MLTPAFEITQDEDFIMITIKAPFTKVSESEIYVEAMEFKFYSKPYYLRLTLPGNIVEDGRQTALYDSDTGTFTITVAKETPGEQFEGLDLLTKLLAPKGKSSAKQPLIELVGATAKEESEESEEEFDWLIEQHVQEEREVTLDCPKYGFANLRDGVFSTLKSELGAIVDLQEPDLTPAHQRRKLRMAQEDEKFDDDHYLADFYSDDAIQEVIRFTPTWCKHCGTRKDKSGRKLTVNFSEEEKALMRKLPNKEYILGESELCCVYLGLVDIIYAYCYNHRTTEGENTVESAWTICKLSSTLSWLDTLHSLHDVAVSSCRRCLCFPLYRHWQLSQTLLHDVTNIFSLGKQQIVKCLLEMHRLLQDSETYYILNDLYVTNYCVWVQSASDKRLECLAVALSKINLKKEDLGFHLEELEMAAESVMAETELESVSDDISKLSMSEGKPSNDLPLDSVKNRDSDDDSTDTDDVSTTCGDDESTESDDEASSSDGNFRRAGIIDATLNHEQLISTANV